MDTTQVLVVGAGPVGLALAGELRLGGAGVTVVERRPAPMTESRASTLHALAAELLDQRGLLPALGACHPGRRGHFAGLPLDLGDLPTTHAGVWKVPQTRIEAVLAGWAHGLGAVIRRGVALRDLSQGPDGVEVTLEGPDGRERLRARYVVGCDGEDSTVARLGAFDVAGTGPEREMLRADLVGADVPDRRFERHEHGLAVSATGPDGVTRVMAHVFGRAPSGDPSPPDAAEIAAAWRTITGQDLSGARTVWSDRFADASVQAARYCDGRILLAGDAAHRQMPVGGQALNLGLHDAFNLGWKLAAHVRGQAPDWLLDSYDEERRAEGARALDLIRAQSLLLLGGHEVDPLRTLLAELMEDPTVHRALAMRVSGLDARCGSHAGDGPLDGHRPPYDLFDSADRDRVRAALAVGRGLLVEDTRSGWVLLRPDGYAAASGAAGTDPASALALWYPGGAAPSGVYPGTGEVVTYGQV